MKTVEKSWNDFWAYYWRVTQRSTIPGIREYDRKVVSLVQTRCNLISGQRVLDLGCGAGDQALLFAESGFQVVGIDIAEPLIQYATAQAQGVANRPTFVAADMLTIGYDNEFDLCMLLSGTFGFFSDSDNATLLKKIHTALREQGHVFIMYISAHRKDLNETSWQRIDGGYQLTKRWFESETCRYHSTVRLIMDNNEEIVPCAESGYHANEWVRCYTPPEIAKMLSDAGFADIVHIGRRHLDDPTAVLSPWETREIVLARKNC